MPPPARSAGENGRGKSPKNGRSPERKRPLPSVSAAADHCERRPGIRPDDAVYRQSVFGLELLDGVQRGIPEDAVDVACRIQLCGELGLEEFDIDALFAVRKRGIRGEIEQRFPGVVSHDAVRCEAVFGLKAAHDGFRPRPEDAVCLELIAEMREQELREHYEVAAAARLQQGINGEVIPPGIARARSQVVDGSAQRALRDGGLKVPVQHQFRVLQIGHISRFDERRRAVDGGKHPDIQRSHLAGLLGGALFERVENILRKRAAVVRIGIFEGIKGLEAVHRVEGVSAPEGVVREREDQRQPLRVCAAHAGGDGNVLLFGLDVVNAEVVAQRRLDKVVFRRGVEFVFVNASV